MNTQDNIISAKKRREFAPCSLSKLKFVTIRLDNKQRALLEAATPGIGCPAAYAETYSNALEYLCYVALSKRWIEEEKRIVSVRKKSGVGG